MNKVTINKKEYSRTQLKNNILRVWNSAPLLEKYDWYSESNQKLERISRDYFLPLIAVCGMTSALSPLTSWAKNLENLEIILSGKKPGTLGLSILKAKQIRSLWNPTEEKILAILKGKKTSAFFLNLLNPENSDHLTIDRHAISIAISKRLTNDELSLTPKQYVFIQEAYQYTARSLNVSPLTLQSATWLHWRSSK